MGWGARGREQRVLGTGAVQRQGKWICVSRGQSLGVHSFSFQITEYNDAIVSPIGCAHYCQTACAISSGERRVGVALERALPTAADARILLACCGAGPAFAAVRFTRCAASAAKGFAIFLGGDSCLGLVCGRWRRCWEADARTGGSVQSRDRR